MTDKVVRVPNLPSGKIVDENFNATDDELTFRQVLITSLQDNFGDEGVVIPSQPTTAIATIQANQNQSAPPQYTCQAGTFIYDSTTDEVKVAILVAGVPTFKVVQVV